MAYKVDKNPVSGTKEIVIDGFEKGIANSPYTGIANIRNLNINYWEGVAYVNYKRQACTMSGGTLTRPVGATQSPAGLIYVSDDTNQIFKQNAVNSSTFTLIGSNPGTGAGGIQYWNNYLISFRTAGGIDICGDGSGDSTIISANWNTGSSANGVWPLLDATITLTGTISGGATTATISSYADGQGTSRAFWNGPTGTYLIRLGTGTGQAVNAVLTQGSATISWTPPATNATIATIILYTTQAGSNNGYHSSLVSRNDGNLYFGSYNYVCEFGVNIGFTSTFSKTNFNSFFFNGVTFGGLSLSEQVQWLEELESNLLIAGNFNISQWNRVSNGFTNPVPVPEGISKIINIQNKVYVFAGNKGNIYVYNGYSANRFKKIPDCIVNVIDPTWSWGGVMSHRQKLFFQATATNNTGTPILTGIWSINLDTEAITMEAQNSNGVGGSTTDFHGVLIDNSAALFILASPGYTTFYDSYYSASCTLSGGNYTGLLDYNNTTPWGNNEPYIETDLIPVGTAAEPKTFQSVEFKLDKPLANGDSISVYARSSLSASYVQVLNSVTATAAAETQVLSSFLTPFNQQKFQWIQFKITFACASSNSSFIPLREIRFK